MLHGDVIRHTSTHLSPSIELESSMINMVLYFLSNSRGSSAEDVELDRKVDLLCVWILLFRNDDIEGDAGSIVTRACFFEPKPASLSVKHISINIDYRNTVMTYLPAPYPSSSRGSFASPGGKGGSGLWSCSSPPNAIRILGSVLSPGLIADCVRL